MRVNVLRCNGALLLVGFSATGWAGLTDSTSAPAMSVDRIRAHVSFLASDELEGRGTGDDGIDLAAGYIAANFSAAGLKPGGPDGGWFQRFTIDGDPKLTGDTHLAFTGKLSAEAALRTDFVPFGFSGAGKFDADIVFVGYGIVNEDRKHDDYAGVDVQGKVVLMLRREPAGWNSEGIPSRGARFETKAKLAAEKGAAALMIVNQAPGPDDADTLMPFGRSSGTQPIPAIHVSRTLADRLLAAGSLPSISQLQKKLDDEGCCASVPLNGVRATGEVAYDLPHITARNVIGVLIGTGSHADEYVVIGAHYDHLGIRRDQIHNGADDNASGTSAVMELARAFASTPVRERSIIFMTFSGEEIGLNGSRHFAAHPTVPIESIKAMINMDMIGRLDHQTDENMLAIQGLGTGSTFKEIVSRRAEGLSVKFIPDDSAIGPSDHDSFYRAGVPSLFFYTGDHADYHQPGDDTEKANFAGIAEVAELVRRIAADLVDGAEPPAYAEVTQPARIFRGSGVVLGIIPDREDDSDKPGWRVAAVMPNGGAGKAGIKAGDRITSVNGHPVGNVADYRSATKNSKPGETVDVVVVRGEETLDLKVELSARGPR